MVVARVPARKNAGESGVGRVAVGIDPSRAALQIALLSPRGDERRERRVPLGPAAVDVLGEVLAGEQAVIAIEGSHSTGQLFLLELLARKYDVREIQPFVSKRFRQALSDDHTDQKDARGLAQLAALRRGGSRVRRAADLPRNPSAPRADARPGDAAREGVQLRSAAAELTDLDRPTLPS